MSLRPDLPPFVYSRNLSYKLKLERPLGKGALKVVYLAESRGGRKVAVLFHEVMNEAQARRECGFLDACKCIPGVVHLLGDPLFFIESDGTCYIQLISEVYTEGMLDTWALGKTLRDRLQLFIQVAKTVDLLHQKGLLHGDIKPENIGIVKESDRQYRSVLSDLGCMMKKEDIQELNELSGTLAYLPPGDQKNGSNPLARDVFALGATLYDILSDDVGQKGLLCRAVLSMIGATENQFIAYLFNTKQEMINKAIRQLRLYPSVENLLTRTLVLDPNQRCGIEDVIRALEVILQDEKSDFLNEVAERIPEPSTPLLKRGKPSFPED